MQTYLAGTDIFVKILWFLLKHDLIHMHAWKTGTQAKAGVGRWVSAYTHHRQRTAHGGQAPAWSAWKASKLAGRRRQRFNQQENAGTLGSEETLEAHAYARDSRWRRRPEIPASPLSKSKTAARKGTAEIAEAVTDINSLPGLRAVRLGTQRDIEDIIRYKIHPLYLSQVTQNI